MKIQYSDNLAEDTSIVISEVENKAVLVGNTTNDTYLDVRFPFAISKIKPELKDPAIQMENVYVFRNFYFSEFDHIVVKGVNKTPIGFLFKPSIIFNTDAAYLYKENKILQTAIYRSIIQLFQGRISLKPDSIKKSRNSNYILNDFIPSDVIFGVFPYELNSDFQDKDLSELLLNLYLYGFYFLNNENDTSFDPPRVSFQEEKYNSLILNEVKFYKTINLNKVAEKVKLNKYCSHYFKSILKNNNNSISKFHQAYGLVEIFKDEILKLEINEKICQGRMTTAASGYKIQTDILEISRDSYTLNKLFTKYSSNSTGLLETLFLEISYFLDNCKSPEELSDLKAFPQVFYYLRNIIVHDIQFLFIGNDMHLQKLKSEFENIVYRIEYLLLETLCSLSI